MSDPNIGPGGTSPSRIDAPDTVTHATAFAWAASPINTTSSTDYTNIQVSFSASPSDAVMFNPPSNCTLVSPTSAPATSVLFTTAFSTLPAGYQLNLPSLSAVASSAGDITLIVTLFSSDISGGSISWTKVITAA